MKYPAIEGRLQKLETTSHPMTLMVIKHHLYREDKGDIILARLKGVSLYDL